MSRREVSRRSFLGASAAAGAAVLAHPVNLAAQTAGIKAGDMPDLTIKEAKIYVLDPTSWRNAGAGLSGGGEIASLVTASGIEGNFTLGNGAGGVRTPAGSWVDLPRPTVLARTCSIFFPPCPPFPYRTSPAGVVEQDRSARLVEGAAEPERQAVARQQRRAQAEAAAGVEEEGTLSADSTPALEAERMGPGPRARMRMPRRATSSCGTSWARR